MSSTVTMWRHAIRQKPCHPPTSRTVARRATHQRRRHAAHVHGAIGRVESNLPAASNVRWLGIRPVWPDGRAFILPANYVLGLLASSCPVAPSDWLVSLLPLLTARWSASPAEITGAAKAMVLLVLLFNPLALLAIQARHLSPAIEWRRMVLQAVAAILMMDRSLACSVAAQLAPAADLAFRAASWCWRCP